MYFQNFHDFSNFNYNSANFNIYLLNNEYHLKKDFSLHS